MTFTDKYLCIIPARGGSQRVPRKNIRLLAGKPLIAYTIEAARSAKKPLRIIVSTDDREVAECAASLGIPVPFLRPPSLAGDLTTSDAVIRHVLETLRRQGEEFESLIYLQPTSPLRTAAHIDESIERYESSGTDTLVSVRQTHDHPYWTWTFKDGAFVPFFSLEHMSKTRQEIPAAYIENGAIYILSTSVVEAGGQHGGKIYGKTVVPYIMDGISSLDIDTPEEFAMAEYFMHQRKAEQ